MIKTDKRKKYLLYSMLVFGLFKPKYILYLFIIKIPHN